jgi:hypothetical protein
MQSAQRVAILIIMPPLHMAMKQIPKVKTPYFLIINRTRNMVSLIHEPYRRLTWLVWSVKIRILALFKNDFFSSVS